MLSERGRWILVLSILALGFGLAFSVSAGIHQRVGQDFHVFWQAGRNFATGGPLYHGYLPGARQFKYPPFAAFVFQGLALFPLQAAAVLFSLLNLVLWGAAVYLTLDIAARTFPGRNRSWLPIVLAILFSARFYFDNIHHVQVNELIFVLVLLGVQAYLRGQDLRASAFIVTATAIKITPVFLVAWLLVRGRQRAALAVVPFAAVTLLLPLMLRGPALGAAELSEYYRTFLAGHQHGQVSAYTAGQNIAALVGRMTTDSGANPYAYLTIPESSAQLAYHLLWAIVLLTFLGALVLLRIRRAPVSPFEISMALLASLLLSPITFTTHLVSSLFVFYTVLAIRPGTLRPWQRLAGALLCAGIVASGLSGRDLVGTTLYRGVAGYSIMGWTMLLLFIAVAVLSAGANANDAPRSHHA
jgi:hypothetical protein